MPYIDVPPTHKHFAAIQKIGATGILKGTGVPYKWANQTWFYPDSTIVSDDFYSVLFEVTKKSIFSKNHVLLVEDILTIVTMNNKTNTTKNIINNWGKLGLKNYDADRPIKRFEIAVLIDYYLKPFETKQINHQGSFIN
jgi:hypothetical protein